MGSIVTLGEAMATFASTAITPLRYAKSANIAMSGSEATVAIGATRLGHTATWISRLGDDELGELIRLKMLGESIAVSAQRTASHPTGLMVKERPRGDIRRVHYYRSNSAASTLSPNDLPANVIEDADIFHSSGITAALSRSAAETLVEAIRRAKDASTVVSLDVNYRARLWSETEARSALLPLLSNVDVLFTSLDEAHLLMDKESGAQFDASVLARSLLDLGPSTAIVTMGANGAWLADNSGVEYCAAVPTREVDPFGAGDAFVAGYLATKMDGAAPIECLVRATTIASMAVSTEGDWEGLPFLREVDRDIATDGSISR